MYDRRVEDHRLSFGVSGHLYKGNLLLYDRQTESLWSQITAEAVAGRLTGAKLDTVPFVITTWKEWKEKHPNSLVLSGRSLPAFFSTLGKALESLILPLRLFRLPGGSGTQASLSEMVLGVAVHGEKKAYPLKELAQRSFPLTDRVRGEEVRIFFFPSGAFAYAEDSRGERLPSLVTYRATWFSFYPHSQLYRSSHSPIPYQRSSPPASASWDQALPPDHRPTGP